MQFTEAMKNSNQNVAFFVRYTVAKMMKNNQKHFYTEFILEDPLKVWALVNPR